MNSLMSILTGVASFLLLLAVSIQSATAQDCRTNRAGFFYKGNISTTTSGCTCRPWTDAINTRYADSTFPDGSKAAAGNKCRNPGADTDRPWCYIVAGSCGVAANYDFCDGIPVCSKTCRETVTGTEYNGAISQSTSGSPCLSWSSIYPANYTPLFTADATIPGSVCRNIAVDVSNPSSINFVPWCVTNVGGTPTPSNCSIPFCSQVNPGGCRTDRLGTSYRGNQSTSVTGKTCIRWDSAPGVYTAATWPVSGETISAANNYCRNPNNSPVGLWCLVSTTDWEPCVVPVCVPINGCPSPQSDSYRYKDLITYSGCARWSSVYSSRSSDWYNSKVVPPTSSAIISQPLFHPGVMPDLTLDAAADYCRNPDNDITGPWCPTVAGTKQYCANPCYLTVCMTDTQGLYYAGTVSVTRLNVPCQSWVSKFPVSHPYSTSGWFPDGSAELAKNYCRTPDQNKWGPWCYKSNYNGTGSTWDYCNVPYCTGVTTVAPTASASTDNCLKSTSGTEYAGTMSTSASGKTCIPWTSNTALHTYYLPQMFNAATMSAASNYCRNPDGSTTGPWCYVDATTRENCNIPMCSSPTVVTAPGTTDPVMVILTGIIGMIGLTTGLALVGSLIAARNSPAQAAQPTLVPQSASGLQSAAPRPMPALPPPSDPIFFPKKTIIQTTTTTNETIDNYDVIEDQQSAPPPYQQTPLTAAGQGGAIVQQTETSVTTSQSHSKSSAMAAAARSGGGGGGGYVVKETFVKPEASSAVNMSNGFGSSASQSHGGAYQAVQQSAYSSGGGAGYTGGHSGGGGGAGYTGGHSGGGGGGYTGGHSGGGGGGYSYMAQQYSGGGAGGQAFFRESSAMQRNGVGSYAAGGGGSGGASMMASNAAYHSAYSGGRGGGDRFSVSVTTYGGGGGGGGASRSAATTGYAMSSSSSSGGLEMRERRGSIVDESLGNFLQGGGLKY
ncbi:hypothetical protein BOX15_Mlig018513g1 [Macrostomum lignano]|uniref:Kringle domain-containing protein n=1 Tax=Macrostomum lignano TaxID=282301 RepID=A0A267EUC8_9PLAT|nr:hypothetical protein BOX15_Mlig018513g1 [Macrostomum lignano]